MLQEERHVKEQFFDGRNKRRWCWMDGLSSFDNVESTITQHLGSEILARLRAAVSAPVDDNIEFCDTDTLLLRISIELSQIQQQQQQSPTEAVVVLISRPQNLIITIHSNFTNNVFVSTRRLLQRIGSVDGFDSELFMHALLFHSLQSAFISESLDVAHEEVLSLDSMSFQLSSKEENDLLHRVNVSRQFIARLLTQVRQKQQLLEQYSRWLQMEQHVNEQQQNSIRLGLSELVSTCLSQALARTQLLNDVLSSQARTSSARVAMELTHHNERANLIMRRLNIISTVMLPLLVIQGIFSMNVPIPGQFNVVKNYDWLIGLTCFYLLSATSMFLTFHRLGWW